MSARIRRTKVPLLDPLRRWGRIIAGAFAVTTVALLLLAPHGEAPHPAAWFAAAAVVAAGCLVFLLGGHPLAVRWSVLAALLAAAASAVLFWDGATTPSGYAPWYVRMATIVFAALLLRGRPLAGWLGAAGSYSLLLVAASVTGQPLGGWAGTIVRQAVTLVAIQIFALLIGRVAAAVSAFRAEERARLASLEGRVVGLAARRRELAAIRSLADPVLERLAGGETGADVRRVAEVVGGGVRDVLRGERLAVEPLRSAVQAARARGIDIVLLDDLPVDHPEQLGRNRLARVADRLAATASGPVTVRVSREPSGHAVVTIVDGAGEFAAYED